MHAKSGTSKTRAEKHHRLPKVLSVIDTTSVDLLIRILAKYLLLRYLRFIEGRFES